MVGIKIIDSDREIINNINREICSYINTKLGKCVAEVKSFLKREIADRLNKSEIICGLKQEGHILRKMFGISDPTIISDFVNTYANSIDVLSYPVIQTGGGNISKKKILEIISEDLERLSLERQFSQWTNKENIYFFHWLIAEGDRVVINSWGYTEANAYEARHFSRTHGGFMKQGANRRFSVPPIYAGVIDNNFVSKCLGSIMDDVEVILEKELA